MRNGRFLAPTSGVRIDDADPSLIDRLGLRITSAPQTWLQVAHRLNRNSLVSLGDAMTRRKNPVTTADALSSLMRETFKMKGLALCRDAIELIRPGTDSPMETDLRLLMVDAGLPEPAVNVPALDDEGQFLALPDLSYPRLKIAIEYDGDHHRTDPATWRRDVERRQLLEDAGWLIITATADDVIRYPERLIARIRAAIKKRQVLAER